MTTAAELESALSPANAGARILVRAGVYDVSQTRAQVLLDVIEIPEFKTREYNRAFV